VLNPKLEDQLRRCTTLPSLAAVALQVIDLSNDPDVSISNVAKLIKMDPAISSKVLMVTNSPLYGLRRKVENIRQAIALLGLNACLTLILNFSLVNALRREKNEGIDHDLYWRRSLISSIACQALGTAKGIINLEQLLLSGLLQDIGILALDKLMPNKYGDVYARAENHWQLEELEREALGGSHIEVGAWLLRHWGFPDLICCAVESSHTSKNGAISSDEDCFQRCVALSGWLADIWLNDDRDHASAIAAKRASDMLGMDSAQLADVLAHISDAIPEISDLFEIELSEPAQAELILEQAREALMLRNLKLLHQFTKEQEKSMRHVRQLEDRVLRDGLTGLYNREHLDNVLVKEFANANEHGWPLSLAFIDMDRFKNINDSYGHQFGDKVLVSAAQYFVDKMRQSDIAARYGGEEFMLVLPGLGEAESKKMLNRLLKVFSEQEHNTESGEKVRVTFSAGVATHMDKQCYDSVEDMVRAADRCMYAAKNDGGNRVDA